MTEREAKTKWCPQARTGQRWMAAVMEVKDLNAIAVNRGSDNVEERCRCIASACMWWRWIHQTGSTSGYCGAAGEP